MNSQKFIERNKETWHYLEDILNRMGKNGAGRLSRTELQEVGPLFRRVVSHLAYAQANYPNTEITDYLNRLVARAHSYLYKTETASIRDLIHFYRRGFPQLVARYRKFLIASACFLLLGVALGAVLNHIGSPLAGYVLPAGIKDAVKGNLAQGKVGADIENATKPALSSGILVNNISVSLYCLVLGITWGIGTVYILIQNGLILGALADIYAGYHQSVPFWSLILPHGVFELFAVMLYGAAGLMIASAVVKPGELTRRDALRLMSKPAFRIAMGSIPLLIVAALIEGFITPLKISPWVKLVFSALTALVLFFYLFLGARSKKKGEGKVGKFISL